MSLNNGAILQFKDFTIDVDQRVLLREGLPVALAPKVFDTLLALVENHGRIVLKEDLMNRLWPDTFVEEANLTFNIQQLRKCLGDNARDPIYIQTVARRGYRFIAPVEPISSDNGKVQSAELPFEIANEPDPAAEFSTNVSRSPQIRRPGTRLIAFFALIILYVIGVLLFWRVAQRVQILTQSN